MPGLGAASADAGRLTGRGVAAHEARGGAGGAQSAKERSRELLRRRGRHLDLFSFSFLSSFARQMLLRLSLSAEEEEEGWVTRVNLLFSLSGMWEGGVVESGVLPARRSRERETLPPSTFLFSNEKKKKK